jgi:hypothetical protein
VWDPFGNLIGLIEGPHFELPKKDVDAELIQWLSDAQHLQS